MAQDIGLKECRIAFVVISRFTISVVVCIWLLKPITTDPKTQEMSNTLLSVNKKVKPSSIFNAIYILGEVVYDEMVLTPVVENCSTHLLDLAGS